jgi:hypothetical protein
MKIKKVLFMLNKFRADLKTPKVRYPIADNVHSSDLTWYYFLFKEDRVATGKDQALIKKFDKNRIPINKTYIDVRDKEYVYFPITIGQVGLAVFHTYLKTKSEEDKNRFLKFVDWFYQNAEISDNLGVRWLTDVALPQYRNPGPWQSAFAQSRGISILLRGYQLTGNGKYAKMAEKALIPFTKPFSAGGVTSFSKWGPFYEEYTAQVPTLVLNGMIFSLCGVYDFVRVFPDNKLARKIYEDGIQTLKNILPEYDLGYWSRYNLCQAEWYPEVDPATVGYQRLHITQLEMLYRLTGEEIFKEYAEKFRKQDKFINILRMYLKKYKSLKKLERL